MCLMSIETGQRSPLQTTADEATERDAFHRYHHQNKGFPGVLPAWDELDDSSALKIIYRTVYARPWKHQLFGGNLDIRGTDAETALAILEGAVAGMEASGMYWQISRFHHVPPSGWRGHLYLRLEWGTPGELPRLRSRP